MPGQLWLVPVRRKQKVARKSKAASVGVDSDCDKIDLESYRDSMQKTFDVMQRDLSTIRTSGAHPGILDSTSLLHRAHTNDAAYSEGTAMSRSGKQHKG
jgi:hypothetical protein